MCGPTAHRSNRENLLYIFPMETRGVEIPPKDGKFAYNVKMVVQLGTKLRMPRSPSWHN